MGFSNSNLQSTPKELLNFISPSYPILRIRTMKKKLLTSLIGLVLGLLISFSANADLEQAIAFAEAGDVETGQMELVNIARRAMEGDPQSMCEFGEMYAREGYWIVQSDKDASDWWLKSAEAGYVPCQFSIGAAYLIGFGIDKDLAKAKFWLGKAKDSANTSFANASKELYEIHELDKY